MGALSPAHLIIILVIALLVIGPGKLPETGAALGRAIREFRHAVDGKDEAATPAPDGAAPVTASPTPAGPPATDEAATAESGGTGPV
jgi:sec-independent protein translocase protein TatA